MPNKAGRITMTAEPYVMVSISAKSNRTLKHIATKQGFKTKSGNPSRAQAVEYLIKNFESPIA